MRYSIGLCMSVAIMSMTAACAGPRFTWEPAAKMPIGKGGQVCGFVDGKLMVAGGTYWIEGREKVWTDDLYIYDPADDTWSNGPRVPFAVSYGTGLSIDNRLYVVSGTDGKKSYPYTLVCLRRGREYHWVWGPELPEPRVYASSAAIGSKLYVVGGAADSEFAGKVHNDVMVLDTENLSAGWQPSRPMPGTGRALAAVAAVGDLIYVFGGYRQGQDGMANSDDALVYDTTRDRWRRLPDAPYAANCWEGVGAEGQVYILGGYVTWPASLQRSESFTDQILRFDPKTEQYTSAGELPIPNAGMNIRRMQDGRFITNGGEDEQRHRTDIVAIGVLR